MKNRILASFAVAVAALVLGCAGDEDVPQSAVAKIDDQSIQTTTFNHWLQVAAGQTAGQSGGGQAAAPNPANGHRGCVAAKRKAAPKPTKGQSAPTDAQLRQQCQQEYTQLRDQVLNFLIAANWVQGEAADQGVRVTDQELDKAIQEIQKSSFPKKADFDKYLQQAGLTMDDVRFQTRVEQLQNKLVTKIQKGQGEITDAQVQRYYDKNRSRFGQPERRDVELVLTRTEARAEQAKRALDGGASFASVVKRFSQDDTTKQNGGKIPGVVRGQQLEKALDDAVFSAAKGRVSGPVKTQFGFYVFRVTNVAKAEQQSLKQATPTIRQILQQEAQTKAIQAFVRDYRTKWTEQTTCREGFVVASCNNATKEQKAQAAREQRQAEQAQQQGQQAPPAS